MNWLTCWLNRRAVRRFDRIHERDLLTSDLARQGRYGELAEQLAVIARDYARQTRVVDYHRAVVNARIRRCEALVRSGQRSVAEAEAEHLAHVLRQIEGPGGPTETELGERMSAAIRATESGGTGR